MSHTHERIETKNALVYKGLKPHGLIYQSHIKLRKRISYASIGAKKSNGANFAFNQVKGENKIYS